VTGGPPDGGTAERPSGTLSGPAPGVFSVPADSEGRLPPLHDAEVVTTLHADWARAAAPPADEAPGQGQGAGGGRVRAKVRARVAGAGTAASATLQQQDRALIGGLIRAVDALARRVDDHSARLVHLEQLVEEVVDQLSEDVVRVQVALEQAAGRGPSGPPPTAGAGTPDAPRTVG
jgi:hypothetical protein